MDKDEVKLLVNGVEFSGWKEVEIVAGIERLSRDFTLSVTDRWPGATDIPRRVRQGDVCEVFIGKDKVLTGHVDATPIRYDARSVAVGVKGRSRTADLVDCVALYKTGQWSNAKVEQIARDLAEPFKVKVFAISSTGEKVQEHSINFGETVFECIDRLLAKRQLLVTDDEEGRMVFINAGSAGPATTALVYGENILSADASLDYKDVFSEYTVIGQTVLPDEPVAFPAALVKDESIARYRPMRIEQHGKAYWKECHDRARFERDHRAAKALEVSYVVAGWRQEDGSLWRPNQRVRVVDPVIGFKGEFLIVEAAYRKSEAGTTTNLRIGLASGYIPSPEAEKKATALSDSWVDVQPIK